MAKKTSDAPEENPENSGNSGEFTMSPGESISFEVPRGTDQNITVNVVGGVGSGGTPRTLFGCVWSVFQGCGCIVLLLIAIGFIGSLFP
jgi:hypothetical protein